MVSFIHVLGISCYSCSPRNGVWHISYMFFCTFCVQTTGVKSILFLDAWLVFPEPRDYNLHAVLMLLTHSRNRGCLDDTVALIIYCIRHGCTDGNALHDVPNFHDSHRSSVNRRRLVLLLMYPRTGRDQRTSINMQVAGMLDAPKSSSSPP